MSTYVPQMMEEALGFIPTFKSVPCPMDPPGAFEYDNTMCGTVKVSSEHDFYLYRNEGASQSAPSVYKSKKRLTQYNANS